MRKIGYFFFTFVPLLAVLAIQMLASFYLYGCAIIGEISIGAMSASSESTLERIYNNMLNTTTNTVLMIVYALITIAIFGIWYYMRYEGDFLPSPQKYFNPLMITSVIVIIPGAQFFASYIISGVTLIRPDWLEQYEQLFDLSGGSELTFTMFIYAVILAPICEELIFRGVTLRCARKALPFWLANIMQAALFGIFHLNWIQGIYAFALGIVLGYFCEKGGSIYYSMGLHFLFNLWGSLAVFLPEIPDTIAVAIILLLIMIISLTAGFVLFYVGRKKRRLKYGF